MFRLIYIYRADAPYGSGDWDPTSKEAEVAIATAVLMNTSVVMTCVPFLKPLMEHLQPGWSTNDVVKGVGYNAIYGKGSIHSGQYPMGSVISGQSGNSSHSKRIQAPLVEIKRTDMFKVESKANLPSQSSQASLTHAV